MTSTHTRPAEPTSDSLVESLAPLPAPPSLAALRDALSSPGVIPSEVDALIAAIAQRPDGDPEALRERTDYLLSLMTLPGDASVLTGSAGITVRTAAVEALLELGYPYALEVPPDALERARREQGLPTTEAPTSRLLRSPILATAVTLLGLVMQLIMMALPQLGRLGDVDAWLTPYLLPIFAPAVLAILGTWTKARPLQYLGSLGLGIQGLLWFGGVLMLTQAAKNIPWLWVAAPWYLPLIACYLVWPRKQSDDPARPLPPPETPEAAS
ncbi:hypothetical protein BHS05_36790 [Myxococcus xanthus]|uniref:Uncharacterized protein n=1 Tax=Myxococcus xanthus TaxID=34 RepID=A0AAE6KW25_MYXXA|nr:hypothetical protein BHS09_36995 [Myxococcus xanthus]QDE79409.1 hypothetical protein BHS08_37020 [Myxococcus xanthus]QDF00932.1 hypothetical protein BHS05_36790 [Myxococcus xanthus]